MLIFVERAARPIEPKAGALFLVGLPIFVSVRHRAINNLILVKWFLFCIDSQKWLHNVCGNEKYGLKWWTSAEIHSKILISYILKYVLLLLFVLFIQSYNILFKFLFLMTVSF